MITTGKEQIERASTVECEHDDGAYGEYRLTVSFPSYGPNSVEVKPLDANHIRVTLDMSPAILEAVARHTAHIQHMHRAEAALELKNARDNLQSSTDELAPPLLDRVTAESCRPNRATMLMPKDYEAAAGIGVDLTTLEAV